MDWEGNNLSTFLWIALSLFVISAVFLFFFVKSGESEEEEPAPLPRIALTASMLALIVTATLAGFMLIPMGAMFIAQRFVEFQTDISSIVFIGAIVVIYSLIFDHLLHMVIQRVVRFHSIHHVLFNIVRFFIFLGIASFVSLSTKVSIWIAVVLTVLFIIIDMGDRIFSKKEQPHT